MITVMSPQHEGTVEFTLARGLAMVELPYGPLGVRVTHIFDHYIGQYPMALQEEQNRIELRLHDVLIRAQPTDIDYVRYSNRIGLCRNVNMERVVETHGGSLLANVLKALLKAMVAKNKIVRGEPSSPYRRLPGRMPEASTIMIHLGGPNNNHPHGTSGKIQAILEAVAAGNCYRERVNGIMSKYFINYIV